MVVAESIKKFDSPVISTQYIDFEWQLKIDHQ